MNTHLRKLGLAAITLASVANLAAGEENLERNFIQPPPAARPWVYWFPLDGNLSSNGITLDLEAMRRVGIGGVLYMETDQGAPRGPAKFAGPLWRDLFHHLCQEAARLGLEVNMNNDAGWCGSGGPWITPQLSMQRVVWSQTNVAGPRHFAAPLPQAKATANYYRDIAVFAYPTPAQPYTLPHLRGKSAAAREEIPLRGAYPEAPAGAAVPRAKLVELTARLEASGKLVWDVPPGAWTILRLGHTTTGKDNHPAPIDGRGLECDKLSKTAAEAHFNGLMGKLIADNRPLVGERRTLVSTHIDSWEVGSQNWTPKFREEFRRLRGYDPLPYLPVMSGLVVDNLETSERFLYDVRRTVNELLLENYAGHFRTLAHRYGIRLSIEAYDDAPVDDLAYGGQADEPMAEFWSWGRFGAAYSCTEMASSAHVYGRKILGAEAFTATDGEKWLGHPGNIKDLGDWAFCEGINRFVFHRYALQPWEDARPGMSMGPWGLHYERTQTWWEQSKAWHEYLARCQYLLQQGLPVADLCFLAPESTPQRFRSPVKTGYDRPGYNFDGCPPEVLFTRMKVKNGRLVLPDGMSYQVLVLPQTPAMTPQLLRKIKELLVAGATVVGEPPAKSPSLTGYPGCDAEVRQLVAELWGKGPAPAALTARAIGKGRLFWGGDFKGAEDPGAESAAPLQGARWIWRNEGQPAQSAPVGKRYFRRTFRLEPERKVASAQFTVTADNRFEAWINGRRLGEGEEFRRAFTLKATGALRPGTNLIAVLAMNTTDQPNPAGVIGKVTIHFADGQVLEVATDGQWESATDAKGNWAADATAAGDWSPALALGPAGMEPWGEIETESVRRDPIPDINLLCRFLAAQGVAPDFQFQASSSVGLRYHHKRIGDTDVYFVANKNPRLAEALCSFRVAGRRPEFWWPDTGKTERPAAYDLGAGLTRVPLRLEPYASVFVVFRAGAQPEADRVLAARCNGGELWSTAETPAAARVDNNAGVTKSFTMAAWLQPQAGTELPREQASGVTGFGGRRNDALFPPPGHEVYGEDTQAGAGLAAGTNGVVVFEHGADHFAPVLVQPVALTNWTHVAVVYRAGAPELYLDGQLARKGLASQFTVHPGVGVSHGREVHAFRGSAGEFAQFDRALSAEEVARLSQSMPRPAARQSGDALFVWRDARGDLWATATQAGDYELKTANGGTKTFRAAPAPAVDISSEWQVQFDPRWGGPAEPVTFGKLEDWARRPEPGIRYYSGTAVYRKTITAPAERWGQPGAPLVLDLGRVAVMAEVRLNGKNLGTLWKAPFQVDIAPAMRAGENTLEIKVVNLWVNRQIGDEQLPEDSQRQSNGTLKAWPEWLQQGKASPTGRYTFTSWRLWHKNDALVESGLLGPVTLRPMAQLKLSRAQ